MKKPELIALLAGNILVLATILLEIVQPWRGTMLLFGLNCMGFSIGWKLKSRKGGE